MINKEQLLEKLSNLLKWKQSKVFMAEKLNISVYELNELLAELRSIERDEEEREISDAEALLQNKGLLSNRYNVDGGWVKEDGLSIRFSNRNNESSIKEDFLEFLKTYKPEANQFTHEIKDNTKHTGCLIINKQDAHLNKYDVDGDNSIQKRFINFHNAVANIANKASCSTKLSKIIYILGSDEFNSEFTGRTTHDTPQHNIMDYHTSFEAICNHEIAMIRLLEEKADHVHILYVPGNHDEHVGWHMVSWLKTYFRNCLNLHFDISPSYTKYVKYSNTGLCFNHGYVVKPETLAQNFPIEFKEYWSSCDNFAIFAGDKHTELSRTIGGIKFYRLAAISKSKSRWDGERGYGACQGEITAFLVSENEGITDIYYKKI